MSTNRTESISQKHFKTVFNIVLRKAGHTMRYENSMLLKCLNKMANLRTSRTYLYRTLPHVTWVHDMKKTA